MKTMDELLTKLKQDGYRVSVIAYRLEEHRKLKEREKDPNITLFALQNAIHEESREFRFLCGALWTLNMLGYISDDDREALMYDLGNCETSSQF